MSAEQTTMVSADLNVHWTAGKVVIVATVGEGPYAGRHVVCVTPRATLKRGVKEAERKRLWSDSRFMESLTKAIRTIVWSDLPRLSPANDKNFMGDLALMMGIKTASKNDSVLNGSGLFSLLLAVDEDASKSWEQRGFLSARDVHSPIIEVS